MGALRLGLPAALALGALARLAGLGRQSLWFDEATTLAVAGVPFRELAELVTRLEGAPPLHYAILHFWLKLFADPLVGLRLFSALCGAASLAVFWAVCRRLLGDKDSLALWLACLSSAWLHIAQDGRAYALFLLLSLCQLHLLLRLLERWSPRPALAYALVGILGLYTHNFYHFVLLCQGLCLVGIHRRKPAALLPWLGLFAAIGAAYAPWLVSLRRQIQAWQGVSVLAAPFDWRQLLSILGTHVFDTSFLSFAHEGWTRAIGLGMLAAAAAGLFLRPSPLSARPRAALLCLVPLIAAFAGLKVLEVALGRPVAQARYLIFLSPFLYIWLTLVVESLPVRAAAWARAGLLALFFLGSAGYFASRRYVDPRLSALSGRLRQEAAGLPVVHLDAYYYTPLRYYYLPERRHYLAAADRKLNWDALPGYRAVLSPSELAALGPCLVVDPFRRFFPARVGKSSGAELARLPGG